MADRIILPRATDSNGDIVAGAKATFFVTGTTTPLTVYSDAAGTVPVSVPLLADSEGVFAPTFTTAPVKVVVTNTSDAELPGFESDPHYISQASGTGASAITFNPITGNAATNVQTAIANLTALWNAVTTYGKSIIAAADAAAARTVLGLGAAATAGLPDDEDFANNGTDAARRDNVLALQRWVKIGESTLSGDTDCQFTGLTGYNRYKLTLINVTPDTDGSELRMRTSSDNGSSYDSGASDYEYATDILRVGSTDATDKSAAANNIVLTGNIGNASTEGADGDIVITSAGLAAPTKVQFDISTKTSSGDMRTYDGWGWRDAAAAVDAIQIRMNSGNISGTIILEGGR